MLNFRASVCIGGGRHGNRDEVNQKLGTCLTMTWELEKDLVGQPREKFTRPLKCHSCGKSSLSPSPHLGWLISFSQVFVPLSACTVRLSCNMSLSRPAANL